VANVIVIQLTSLVAVQEQLWPVITERALLLPIEVTDTVVGVMVAVHWAWTVGTLTTKISATNAQQDRSVIGLPPLGCAARTMVHIARLPHGAHPIAEQALTRP
jgi:hypothetical protein